VWFKFPKGAESISVEQQSFGIEAKDAEGGCYFRAPNHFAAKILGIPGFITAEPPEGSPADLPLSDPLRDGAISELSRENDGLKQELQQLREDLGASTAKIMALNTEKTELLKQVAELEGKVLDLEEQIEDKPLNTASVGKK
jgi:hypothetical protein